MNRLAIISCVMLLSLSVCLLGGCQKAGNEGTEKENTAVTISSNQAKTESIVGKIAFTSPLSGAPYSQGDTVVFAIELPGFEMPDSVVFYKNGQILHKAYTDANTVYKWSTADEPLGRYMLSAMVFSGEKKYRGGVQILLMAEAPPKKLEYRILNKYPHDVAAFTQGLTYHDGYLYEGTGRKGQSAIRKIDLTTGQLLQIQSLGSQYFGEGIAIRGDELVQITWESRTGFVYDLASFRLKRTFNYATEGWGLTYDGQYFIMSDGTEVLYFLDAFSLSEVKRIEVYDEEKAIGKLNELEFINGEIFANVYETNTIVAINPKSGKVTGTLALPNLLTDQERAKADVLNGIAYDEETGRLWITGKLWPWLYEIAILPE